MCAEDIFDQESSTLHILRIVANDGLPDSNTFIGYDVIVTLKSVERFYEIVSDYQADLAVGSFSEDEKAQILAERFDSLTPSTKLKLSEIFSSGN